MVPSRPLSGPPVASAKVAVFGAMLHTPAKAVQSVAVTSEPDKTPKSIAPTATPWAGVRVRFTVVLAPGATVAEPTVTVVGRGLGDGVGGGVGDGGGVGVTIGPH